MSSRFASPSLLVAGALLASCSGGNGEDPNPLDRALAAEFEAAGYQPVPADPYELCNRLAIDMLGVRLGRAELERRCVGRDPKAVVEDWQDSAAYRETQRRRWADRFHYNDYTVDIVSLKALDDLVDDLYRGRIGYGDFAEIALSHPGFVGPNIGYGQPELVAEAAFQAFLGRSATTPERFDLANLWKPWQGSFFVDGPFLAAEGGIAGYGYEPMVDPLACEAGVRSCESTLLGYASIEFPRDGREGFILASDLTGEDWAALREPGRLFRTLPMFWEAQVDEVLVRYLGYDLGRMRPAVRQALVEYFQKTHGDLAKLEYMVLTSWPYRQSAEELPERPGALRFSAFAYGPTKTMIPETFLRSVGVLAGEEAGNCDWRYPNLPDWHYPNEELDDLLDDVYPREADGSIDAWFRDMAVQMGGCPGTMDFNTFRPRVRSSHVGLMTAVAHEEAVVELCLVRDARGLLPDGMRKARYDDDAIRAVTRHVLERAVGAPVAEAEVEAAFQASRTSCSTCTAEAVARDLCAGVASGVEFLFY